MHSEAFVIFSVFFFIYIFLFIVKMQNIWNLTDHISDIFNCYSASINGMSNARELGEKYKTFEFTPT